MGRISAAAARTATEIGRQDCRDKDAPLGDVLAEIAREVLWPKNTAPHLAALCCCSVRTAERYLGGECDWSGDAIAAIVSEILRRHSMRNVKIVPRR